ncbi:MAG: exonuclease [Mesorhizobium sp.]|uniref:lambda exonuclease family protein n=1 Tax=Mesorhizobium sp. TaxID=1871066 RepID=UPI000FE6CA50|nr:lambda exonuclease family protein [Mesorhizobium sp.]RWL14837.1 MAG: exonuclease [Mesorhizobium sp.]
MTMEIFDFAQGSDEWRAARCGIPTSSEFHTVMAKGKDGGASVTRRKYLLSLAGEIVTGELTDSYSNGHMDRGRAMEDEARETYAFINDADIRRVGFIRNGKKGASPDSLVGTEGGLEIKTALAHIQIDRLLRGTLPPEHKAQVQGNIWLAEREWWDFVSFWPKLPLLKVRVFRDDIYIKTMAAEIDAFNAELAEMVERIRNYDRRSEILKNQLVQSVMGG